MNFKGKITGYKKDELGTHLILLIPDENVKEKILKFSDGRPLNSELRIDDGRRISSDQRKKIFATIKDIADYLGDVPEYYKELLKFTYCYESGEEYFSLSDCSIDTARQFINYIIDFILANDIPLSEAALSRTDDIDKYLWSCLKFRRCAICGAKSDLHHWSALGSGRNRKHYDDSEHKKIALCRTHHIQAHTIGRDTFSDKYKVYGVIYKES